MMVISDTQNQQKMSILKDTNKKKAPVLVGEREFSEAEIKLIKQFVSDFNSFIEEDGLVFKNVFEKYDKGKDGTISYTDFANALEEDLGVELDDAEIKKSLKLTQEFCKRDGVKDRVEYMKMKDLIDGKLDKKVVFELNEDEGPKDRNAQIKPENKTPEELEADKKFEENFKKIVDFYRTQKLTKGQFAAKFALKKDRIEEKNFV